MSGSQHCAHETCKCTMGPEGGIKADDGRKYCSMGCMEGKGCDCPDCDCRMDTVDDSASEIPMI